ncbi:MAG TPA: hypothetical protein VJ727_00985 [Rhodanobacteraceae bacterium]|nr:hypothetical protein [Rhodanobacteraceae bacterium]
MKARFLLLPLLLAPALGGCSSSSGDGYTNNSGGFATQVNGHLHFDFDNDALILTRAGHPDARIGPDGDFRIGDKTVALTQSQRDLLRRFYSEVKDVRDDGIATGKAGAALGVNAVSNVVESLFSNDHGKNDADMQANSRKVEAAARKLCSALVQVKATQREIDAQLPAFEPYAVFRGEIHCDKDAHDSSATASAQP